jgi:hypothetical protein
LLDDLSASDLVATLERLADQCEVHVAAVHGDASTWVEPPPELARSSRIRWVTAPVIPFSAWALMGRELRRTIDLLDLAAGSRTGHTPCEQTLPAIVRRLPVVLRRSVLQRRTLRRLARWVLEACEAAIPADETASGFLKAERPDVVLVASRSREVCDEFLRGARAVGVPSMFYDDRQKWTTIGRGVLEARRPVARRFIGTMLLRPLVRRAALRLAKTEAGRRERAARQASMRAARRAALMARRVARHAAKERERTERAKREAEARARLEAERSEASTVAKLAYRRYVEVRDWAKRLRDTDDWSPAWTEGDRQQRSALAVVWELPPEAVATLRRLCVLAGGAVPADYDLEESELKARLRRALAFLVRQFGTGLFVPEPPVLGGFGFKSRYGCYNADTVRFFCACAALEDGGVLGEFRQTGRRLVWEIGGGWGGFAYQFKTLFPGVTYVITALPELLVLSAVYLQAVFPAARVRLFNELARGDVWRDWEQVDFIFLPERALGALRPPRIDLVLDVMAMRAMSAPRVQVHAQRAFEAGARYVYSMLPAPPSPAEVAAVWDAIERYYWLHPVPPRGAGPGPVLPGSSDDDPGYAHVIGWRRIRT